MNWIVATFSPNTCVLSAAQVLYSWCQDSHIGTSILGRSGPVETAPLLQMLKSINETEGFMYKCTCACWLLPFLSLAKQEVILYRGRWEEGTLTDRTLGSIESLLVTNSDENTASSEVSQLWLRVQHTPVGLSEPLCQQLLFHFPLIYQAYFLSLVHRDYSDH